MGIKWISLAICMGIPHTPNTISDYKCFIVLNMGGEMTFPPQGTSNDCFMMTGFSANNMTR